MKTRVAHEKNDEGHVKRNDTCTQEREKVHAQRQARIRVLVVHMRSAVPDKQTDGETEKKAPRQARRTTCVSQGKRRRKEGDETYVVNLYAQTV